MLASGVDRAANRMDETDGTQRAAERIECEQRLIEVERMIELDACGGEPAQRQRAARLQPPRSTTR